MAIETAPGLTRKIYIAGHQVTWNPGMVDVDFLVSKTTRQLGDGFAFSAYPLNYDGGQDVPLRLSLTLDFRHAHGRDYWLFWEILTEPDFFPVCLWKPLQERFSGNGSELTFTSRRTPASVALPAEFVPVDVATRFPTRARIQETVGGPLDEVAITASGVVPDDSRGLWSFTVAEAPPAYPLAALRLRYVPVLRMHVPDAKKQLGEARHSEVGRITLEEA